MFEKINSKLIDKLNSYGLKKEPFFFVIDYELNNYDIISLKELPNNILYTLNNTKYNTHHLNIKRYPPSYKDYKKSFNKLQYHIREGDCYLANLTFSTKIELNTTLLNIYNNANSKYKLYYKDKFVSFSPEQFVQIYDNKIVTYPMKGTIDATIKDAKSILLNDSKELAEHIMVVDLLRNDIGKVSTNVKVEKFRYIDKIEAGDKKILQTSSKISGLLKKNWYKNIGDILVAMLPAGSITGTPKKKSVEILHNIETHKRGYFTGVFGVFDGEALDSAVLIRFIEKQSDGTFIYKSGGGITSDSNMQNEYKEMIDKVYIP